MLYQKRAGTLIQKDKVKVMRKINRMKEVVLSFFGITLAIFGICCVVMEWGTAWYVIISIVFNGILLRSIIEQRCPFCGKYALNLSLGNLIAKRPLRCKKCGESIEYAE